MTALLPCGTVAAYERHRRHGEQPCEACREARCEYVRARYVPSDRQPAPCGTRGGYQRHLRRGEESCQECRKAWVTIRRRERFNRMLAEVWTETGSKAVSDAA